MAQANSKTKTVTAQNTFTDPFIVNKGGIITLFGTFSATVVLQKRLLDGVTWVDVTDNDGLATTFTLAGTYEMQGEGFEVEYRVGVKTGGYTSGTVNIEVQCL